MKSDKRKSPRKPLRYSAWIALDDEQRVSCLLSDVSDSGARLEVGNDANIPAQFVLLLAQRNAPKRYCTVVWRENNQIGVRFERRNEKVAPPPTRTIRAIDPASPSLAPDKPEADDIVAVPAADDA